MSFLKGKKVFVVDDEPDIREILVDSLSPKGAIIESFPDGQAALDAFAEHNPEIVLSDGAMPKLDGLGLFREIRKDNKEVSLVLISAYADKLEQKALNAGADAIFIKPFKLDRLNQFLERLVRDGSARKRRLHARIFCRLKILADIQAGERIIQAHTFNLSLGGFFIQMETGELPAMGSKVHFELPIQKEWTSAASGNAECRWLRQERDVTGPRGFGLKFEDPSPELIEAIELIIIKYRPEDEE